MKTLIIARHGKAQNDRLDAAGIQQMQDMAGRLRPLVEGKSALILTSTAGRALQSAHMLVTALSIPKEEHGILWSDDRHKENLLAALQLVRSKQDAVEVLILVTHLEYAEDFPDYFSVTEFGCEMPGEGIGRGQAWVIDCEAKTITLSK